MRTIATLSLLLSLAACMTTPATSLHQPMSVRPPPPPPPVEANGSIFQQAYNKPIFEDRRARHVGDTITVALVEKTTASKASNATATRGSSTSVGLPTISGVPGKFLAGLSVAGTDDTSFAGKGAAAANNVFTGTITVTVTDVYSNGNLLVSGEKQIAINKGEEFIRLSGVVNPAYVTSTNTVQSTQIADARIEYKGSGYIDESQDMGWLQRFFLNVLPF